MTPIRFGPLSRRLFGLYHAPDERKALAGAVLLCNAFGHEAMRVHRFYRLLAERLSRQGLAVLRFDYHGTGDSPGHDEVGELDGWAEDVREAHRELLRRCGARLTTWFGARLGGQLALRACMQAAPPVQRLVLWDAVFDGRAYLEELGRAHVAELELGHNIPDAAWRRAIKRDPLAFSGECLGFAIPARLREQLLALHDKLPTQLQAQSIRLLARPGDAQAERWANAVQSLALARVQAVTFSHPLVWTSNPFADNEMVPAAALQRMLTEIHSPTTSP